MASSSTSPSRRGGLSCFVVNESTPCPTCSITMRPRRLTVQLPLSSPAACWHTRARQHSSCAVGAGDRAWDELNERPQWASGPEVRWWRSMREARSDGMEQRSARLRREGCTWVTSPSSNLSEWCRLGFCFGSKWTNVVGSGSPVEARGPDRTNANSEES